VNVGTGITANTILCIDPKTNSSYCNATGNANGAASASQKGTSCTSGTVCVNGKCEPLGSSDACDYPTTQCIINGEKKCIDTSEDPQNCGACGYICDEHKRPNATARKECKDNECVYDCDGDYVNIGHSNLGSEIHCVNPKTDNEHCSAKSNTDQGTNCLDQGRVCVNGQCVVNSCTAPSTLCATSSGNQCINIGGTNANHCGACNYACNQHPLANAKSSTCSSGKCQYTCNSGYTNMGTGRTLGEINCVQDAVIEQPIPRLSLLLGVESDELENGRCTPKDSMSNICANIKDECGLSKGELVNEEICAHGSTPCYIFTDSQNIADGWEIAVSYATVYAGYNIKFNIPENIPEYGEDLEYIMEYHNTPLEVLMPFSCECLSRQTLLLSIPSADAF
jgi:hypothetical protein